MTVLTLQRFWRRALVNASRLHRWHVMLIRHFRVLLICSAVLLVIVLFEGYTWEVQAVQPVLDDREYVLHGIDIEGQTLSDLANWFYSRPGLAGDLKNYNVGIVPRHLQLWDTLKIPLLGRK